MSLLLAVNLMLCFSGVVGVHATDSLVENKLSSKGAILARGSAWLVTDQVILLANSTLFSTNVLDFSRFQRNRTTILGLFKPNVKKEIVFVWSNPTIMLMMMMMTMMMIMSSPLTCTMAWYPESNRTNKLFSEFTGINVIFLALCL